MPVVVETGEAVLFVPPAQPPHGARADAQHLGDLNPRLPARLRRLAGAEELIDAHAWQRRRPAAEGGVEREARDESADPAALGHPSTSRLTASPLRLVSPPRRPLENRARPRAVFPVRRI